MSEFEDTDSILRNIDIDENWQEEDIYLDCNVTESPEMPTLVFVDENNIQNVVEWKGTETTGKQKGSKGTLKKGNRERDASCWKCNKS